MGFSILANISKDRKGFYFLFDRPVPSSQEVYRCFSKISILFSDCFTKDYPFYKDGVSPSSRKLFEEKLYVYGFIYELISGNNGNVKVIPKTGNAVLQLMISNGIIEKRPVFIIDECVAISDETLRKIRFVRNCFRSLGLGLVMCGTDSRAAKLTSFIGNSSRSAIAKPWCYVFGKFPKVTSNLLNLPDCTPIWLKQILEQSRPLFAKFVADELIDTNCLDGVDFNQLLLAAFTKLVNVKKIFVDYYGQLG